jgi:hypothetical protein
MALPAAKKFFSRLLSHLLGNLDFPGDGKRINNSFEAQSPYEESRRFCGRKAWGGFARTQ